MYGFELVELNQFDEGILKTVTQAKLFMTAFRTSY